MTDSFYIDILTNRIHVQQYGTGKQLLVLFHGFGESGTEYGALGKLLGKEYTIVVPDLPFHGTTQWGNELLTTDLLKELIQYLLKKQELEVCSILGYSMGGRLAICLAQCAPALINRLILVAPEGLRKNHWFQFATGTRIGRWIFKMITSYPQVSFRWVQIYGKLGSTGKKRVNYVRDLMKEQSVRLRIYHCWLCFRKLRPNTNLSFLKHIAFPPHIHFGKYDRLIPPPTRKEMQKWSPAQISVHSTGHLLFLHEPVLQKIYSYLCAASKHK